MSLSIHNTTDWPAARLLPYGAEITAAMHKLVARFPRDVTVVQLGQEVLAGKKQLWLIMDGEKFVSFVLTEIQINEATGAKTLVIPSFAGDEAIATMPLIAELHRFGRENDCTEARILARKGWTKALLDQGYRTDVSLFRKSLEETP
jgi:hypothetical protein